MAALIDALARVTSERLGGAGTMSHANNEKEARLYSLGATPENGCVLVLEEVGGNRLLPIFAGPNEGEALALKMAGIELPRPMTHDLLVAVARATGHSITKIVVTELRETTFIARLFLEKDGLETSVDARPSDAINIAVRAGCPIYVAERVFAGVQPLLKPISTDEVEKFKEELAGLDPAAIFKDLEGKPGPEEPRYAPPEPDPPAEEGDEPDQD
jgi:bifunctional DNase/RNase